MEAKTGSNVEIQIRVVDSVEAPEKGNGVENNMLQIDGKIQNNHADYKRKPGRNLEVIKQTPAVFPGKNRH